MTTIHKNFKTICGGTLNNVLYEYNLEKNPISHDSIYLNSNYFNSITIADIGQNQKATFVLNKVQPD